MATVRKPFHLKKVPLNAKRTSGVIKALDCNEYLAVFQLNFTSCKHKQSLHFQFTIVASVV